MLPRGDHSPRLCSGFFYGIRMLEPIYTIKQVAEHLQVSERNVSRLLIQHGVPVMKPGRRIRISERSLTMLKEAITVVPLDGNDLLIELLED